MQAEQQTITQAHTVITDEGPNLDFDGTCVAKVSSRASDSQHRWTELALYRTEGGNWVCESIGRSRVDGEKSLCNGLSTQSESAVVAFFGFGWLAKQLYAEAGISANQRVN